MQTSGATSSGTSVSAIVWKTVEEQLTAVNDEILRFDAKKLSVLRGELEAAKKNKEVAKSAYEKAFEGLKKTWCDQNEQILALRNCLLTTFKDWDKLIASCVCPALAEKRRQENYVVCRGEIKGALELARDDAWAALQLAKANTTGWETAAAVLDQQLKANAATIEKLYKLIRTPEAIVAIPAFWFKLLTAHASVRPMTDCFDVPYEKEHPDSLCPPGQPVDNTRACTQYAPSTNGMVRGTNVTTTTGAGQPGTTTGATAAGAPPADAPTTGATSGATSIAGGAGNSPKPDWPRSVPWLIAPEMYLKEIDNAYCVYRMAKDAYADALGAFTAHPDDLTAARDRLKALTTGLDLKIEECLKGKAPELCCDKEASTQSAATTSATTSTTAAQTTGTQTTGTQTTTTPTTTTPAA